MSKINLLKKLAVKTCGLDKASIAKALLKKPQVGEEGDDNYAPAQYHKEVELLKIAGIVYKFTPGQTDLGPFAKLQGDFTGINMLTGEINKSSVAIVDGRISDAIVEMLKGGSEQIQFAAMFTAKHSPTSAVGYEFGVIPLTEVRETDQMSALLERVGMSTAPQLTNESGKTEEPAGNASDAKPADAEPEKVAAPAQSSGKRK